MSIAPATPSGSQSPQDPNAAIDTSVESRRRFPKWPLAAAAGIAFGWILVLVVMTLATANPISLNFAQIEASRGVVIARLGESGTLVPDDPAHWPLPDAAPIRVLNLDETGIKPGQAYIIPLSPASTHGDFSGQMLVTGTPDPILTPLIYPATEAAKKQLAKILPHTAE